MYSDEKCFDQNGKLNHQNDQVYTKSRQEANENDGLFKTRKFPFKVIVWVGITNNGKCKCVVLPPKTTYDAKFYCENVLPIVQRDGTKLIGPDFTFQQDGATCHTAKVTMETIKNMGFSIIRPDRWPANSPDLKSLYYFFWNEVESRLKGKTYLKREYLVAEIKKKS